jgi:hypothetical protein
MTHAHVTASLARSTSAEKTEPVLVGANVRDLHVRPCHAVVDPEMPILALRKETEEPPTDDDV